MFLFKRVCMNTRVDSGIDATLFAMFSLVVLKNFVGDVAAIDSKYAITLKKISRWKSYFKNVPTSYPRSALFGSLFFCISLMTMLS